MKKKVLIIFLGIIGLMFALVAFYTTAKPTYGNTHDSAGCHNSPGGYTITTNTTGTITADYSTVVVIEITATGSNLFVQASPGAEDNDEFIIFPTTLRILDSSGSDKNPSSDAMTVVYSITTPAVDGYYSLFIIAGDNLTGQPVFAYVEISFSVQSYTDISVLTAYEMINNTIQYPNLIILDVREQSEYDVNHLYNATLIPRREISARINELQLYNDTEIIVYCLYGGRSALASLNLANNHNFKKIYNILGGITDWITAGYPVWTASGGAPTIGFSNILIVIALLGLCSVMILYFKKQNIKILQKHLN